LYACVSPPPPPPGPPLVPSSPPLPSPLQIQGRTKSVLGAPAEPCQIPCKHGEGEGERERAIGGDQEATSNSSTRPCQAHGRSGIDGFEVAQGSAADLGECGEADEDLSVHPPPPFPPVPISLLILFAHSTPTNVSISRVLPPPPSPSPTLPNPRFVPSLLPPPPCLQVRDRKRITVEAAQTTAR